MKRLLSIVLLAGSFLAAPAHALKAFACEPEWGALLKELGGDKIDIDVATTALQDVHQIEAKPSLIAKMRRADLIVCSGADLEAGWLPQLLRQANNPRVASGRGKFFATEQVTTLEKPVQLDRSGGDVHPQGNPHIQLDPHRVQVVANALTDRLSELEPGMAPEFQRRLIDFSARWQAAIQRWEARAAPLRGKKVVVHHTSWVYLLQWLGMEQIGALEPKPGVPPTSGHLSSLIESTKSQGAFAILRASYQSPKASAWLSERTGVPALSLPFSVGGDDQARDLFGLFDSTLTILLAAQP